MLKDKICIFKLIIDTKFSSITKNIRVYMYMQYRKYIQQFLDIDSSEGFCDTTNLVA